MMLHNRYFIAVLGVLLTMVALYNFFFFKNGRGGMHPRSASSTAALKRSGDTNPTSRATGTQENYRPSWRRDPFWYPEGKARRLAAPSGASSAARGTATGDLQLEGTSMRNGKGYALINGRVYSVGDTVDGLVISDIGELSVTVKGGSGTRTINLLSGKNRKE